MAHFNETTGKWDIDGDDGAVRHTDSVPTGASIGDTVASLEIRVTVQPDLSVDVTLTGSVNVAEGDTPAEVRTVHVAKDGAETVPDFTVQEDWPLRDRVIYQGITITNAGATAM